MYKRFGKRLIDILLSLTGLILASWLYLLIMIAIEIDDPGPVFFSQKRVGIHKKYFQLYKFRSMKMSTPHDMPTHLLENPEQYITRVGKFLRKTSLDEIPQLWNILLGDMSVIGPRPALWNQEDLLAERDKYGANDVKPGLSGWAQICGRDELEIADKARLDGEYVRRMSFAFDCRCFFGTAISALRGDGVVVSTATGSTGYALSAGGPIVSPDYTGMVCVPIAPHTIQARAFLTSPSDVVEIFMSDDRPSVPAIAIDGQFITCDGTVESVAVRRGPGDVLLLDYGPESFYNSVSRVFYGVRHDR